MLVRYEINLILGQVIERSLTKDWKIYILSLPLGIDNASAIQICQSFVIRCLF